LATLYEAIGLPSRFVTVKADPTRPNDYSHVFLEVNLPKHGWVAADPTMPQKHFGWRPSREFPFKNWPSSLDPESDVRDDVLEPQPVAAREGVNGMNDYLTVPQVRQARPLMTGMGDYLTVPQVRQARPLMTGMGDYLTAAQVQQARPLAGMGEEPVTEVYGGEEVPIEYRAMVDKVMRQRIAEGGPGAGSPVTFKTPEGKTIVVQYEAKRTNWLLIGGIAAAAVVLMMAFRR
jgi:hypothetical protein